MIILICLVNFTIIELRKFLKKEFKPQPLISNLEKFECFEYFIENPAFEHIVQNVFENLSAQDIASCRLVSKGWNSFVINDKHWWRLLLQIMSMKKFLYQLDPKDDSNIGYELLFDRFPAWKITNDHFLKNESTKRLRKYVAFMWEYLNNEKAHNPLLHAAKTGNISFVTLLIKTPTDFNALSTRGKISTPLHVACIGNQLEMIQLLIDNQDVKNIDFDAKGSNGISALHFACSYASLEVVRLLIGYLTSKNIELFQANDLELTIFHQAVQNQDNRVPFYIFNQYKQLFSDIPDSKGCTVIQYALELGHIDIVNYLIGSRLDLGISLETRNLNGSNVLHFAIAYNRHETLVQLMKALQEDHSTIDLNTVNIFGNTPLHLASYMGSLDIVKLLFESKLLNQEMLEALNNNGQTALDFSKEKGHVDISRILLQCHIDFHLRKSVVLERSRNNLSEIANHMQLATHYWKELANLQ